MIWHQLITFHKIHIAKTWWLRKTCPIRDRSFQSSHDFTVCGRQKKISVFASEPSIKRFKTTIVTKKHPVFLQFQVKNSILFLYRQICPNVTVFHANFSSKSTVIGTNLMGNFCDLPSTKLSGQVIILIDFWSLKKSLSKFICPIRDRCPIRDKSPHLKIIVSSKLFLLA